MATTDPKKKTASKPPRKGRPPLPKELRRHARLSMRTYPEIKEKATILGTEAIEELIRKAKT